MTNEGEALLLSVQVDRLTERVRQLEHDLALERRINTALRKAIDRIERRGRGVG